MKFYRGLSVEALWSAFGCKAMVFMGGDNIGRNREIIEQDFCKRLTPSPPVLLKLSSFSFS